MMKQDSSPEDGKKSEKVYINRQQSSGDNCLGLVTLDNTRKELISIEKKCQNNWIKYSHLSGENVKQLVEEYFDGLNDKNDRKKIMHSNKLPGDINKSIRVKSSPPIPKTSSTVVGWRSSLPSHNLEIFGPLYISPRHTIVSLTPGGEIPYQRFIYLG